MSALPTGLTAEEFAALPHDGLRLELVRGAIIAMPPSFGGHSRTAGRLAALLGHHVIANGLGEIYTAEGGFLLGRNPDTVRAPDLAFIQASRITPAASGLGWIPVVPDLVAEVVSSGDRPGEVADKVRMWLDAGVRLVWVAFPERKAIEVHRPGQPVSTLSVEDQLDGANVAPGFSVSVAQIFP
jgi:Uma2 family endonuclease